MPLTVHTLTVGPLQANCHLIVNEETSQAIVVDPGDEAHRILGIAEEYGATITAIWLTHAHIDHIGGLAALKKQTGAPITVHEAEKEWLMDGRLNLADAIMLPYEPVAADDFWQPGNPVEALGVWWRIEHFPGHSPGSVAIISDAEKIAMTGDLIFRGSMGRVDLPGGDEIAMADSLRRFLEEDVALRCYVGHGPDTTVGVEREQNILISEFLDSF